MKKLLDELRASRYGKDAREPIAVSLEDIQKIISQSVSDAEKEVNAARSGYNNLKSRIDSNLLTDEREVLKGVSIKMEQLASMEES